MRQGRTKTQPQIKDKPDVVPKEDGKLMEELKSCPLDEARKILWYCAQLTDGSHWENQYRRALKAVCDELDRRAAPENKVLMCEGCAHESDIEFPCDFCSRNFKDRYAARKPKGSEP